MILYSILALLWVVTLTALAYRASDPARHLARDPSIERPSRDDAA